MVNTLDRSGDGAGCVTLSRASTLPVTVTVRPGSGRGPDLAPLAGHPPGAFQGRDRSYLASGLLYTPPRRAGAGAAPDRPHFPPTLRPPSTAHTPHRHPSALIRPRPGCHRPPRRHPPVIHLPAPPPQLSRSYLTDVRAGLKEFSVITKRYQRKTGAS